MKAGKFDLLYVTPERFRKPDFVEVIASRQIVLLAVDEAHCISEWGHDFRPDYTRVGEIRASLGDPTTIALTATATPDVQRDIVRQLVPGTEEVELFHQGIERPNLSSGGHSSLGRRRQSSNSIFSKRRKLYLAAALSISR